MAKKKTKSILGKLDGLRKMFQRAPKKPSASKEGARKQKSSPSSADQPAPKGDAPEKLDGKKTPPQPWFRHRQRW